MGLLRVSRGRCLSETGDCTSQPASDAAPTLEDKEEIGCLGSIACYKGRLLCSAGATSRVKLESDGSLASGRDRPVELGNGNSSARDDFFDFQLGCADVLYAELMNEFVILVHCSEIINRFGKLDDRRLVCGGGGRNYFRDGGGRVKEAYTSGWGIRADALVSGCKTAWILVQSGWKRP